MPRHAEAGIDVARIVAVDMAERAPQPILVCGYRHDVDMVRHQAMGSDVHLRTPGRFREEIEVEFVVSILEERPFTPITALGRMVRRAGEDEARETGRGDWVVVLDDGEKGLLHLSP